MTMDEKIAIPLYADHLHFLLTRCGWRVTKIRGHFTFELKKIQERFCNYESGEKRIFINLSTIRILVMIVVTILTTVVSLQFMMSLKN